MELEEFGKAFTFQYVSINTFSDLMFLTGSPEFTFQYVSINTPLL